MQSTYSKKSVRRIPTDSPLFFNGEKMTCQECEKLKTKLRMMEISFEQINNSRNDLMKQLTECEQALEKRG